MDGNFPFRPDDPFDPTADSAAKRRCRGPGPNPEKAGGRPGAKDGSGRSRVLDEKDGLFFGVLCRPIPPELTGPQAEASARQPETLADSFRAAFTDVWGRIPEPDRVALLAHWRERKPWRLSHDPHARPAHYPVIRVVDLGAESSTYPLLGWAGNVFHFPAVPTTDRSWASLIPLALAEAYRYATREHGRRVLELIEELMAEWESRRGKKAGQARREKKEAVLEKKFLRVHRRDVARLLARWGFDQPDAAEGPREAEERGNGEG